MPRAKPKKMIGIRKFRETFLTLTEPIDVIRSKDDIKIVGTWIPAQPQQPVAETNG